MFISESEVLKAIDNLKRYEIVSANDNDRKLVSFFLLLKKIGFSEYERVSKIQIGEKKDIIQNTLFDLGGIFDYNEEGGKNSCLFFTNIFECKKSDGNDNSKAYFNAGTEFKGLAARLKDTIDNSLTDSILKVEKSNDNIEYYTLRNNYSGIIKKITNNKYKFVDVIKWIYRYKDFESKLSTIELKALFMSEYNLTENEFSDIFVFSNENIVYSDTMIKGKSIRTKIGVEGFTVINSNTKAQNIILTKILDINIKKIISGGRTMEKNKLKELIMKHKQVILTGVPGTGKTYLIEQLKEDFEIEFIQFHQNYTYQDFITGNTLENGEIKNKPGKLLEIIDKANTLKSSNKNLLLVIDEINRGNISSIFGELIYILDRREPIKIKNTDKLVKLPENLYVIGTMNSADRSIALIDYAIRRRFIFIEIETNYTLVDTMSTLKGEVILGNFLKKLNEKIIKELNEEELILGHSYFVQKEKKDYLENEILEIIHYKIIPLIKEYTYGKSESLYNILSKEIIDATEENIIERIKKYNIEGV